MKVALIAIAVVLGGLAAGFYAWRTRPADMRQQVRAIIDKEVTPLHGVADVERYLGELEARARRQKQVTALELEPGVAAIDTLRGELQTQALFDKRVAFGERMTRLSAELNGQRRTP